MKKQNERDDPIGDIARDACVDPNWPQRADHEDLRDYLPEFLHPALAEANAEYQQHQK